MLPVIFIHKGDSDYLYKTFYQLRISNPDSPVFLIGGSELKKYHKQVTHIEISSYEKDAEKFAEIYTHKSPNGYDYELFCIQRWFILREFLQHRKWERCLYLDSDVMVYCNIDEAASLFDDVGMTISEASGHTNFIRLETLNKFCDFLSGCYNSENKEHILSSYYHEFMNKYKGGISDMTFLWKFMHKYPDDVVNLFKWDNSNGIFNHVISYIKEFDDRFVSDGNLIKVVWEKKKPYFIRKDNASKVLVNTIHFQGNTKAYISSFIPLKKWNFYIDLLISHIDSLRA